MVDDREVAEIDLHFPLFDASFDDRRQDAFGVVLADGALQVAELDQLDRRPGVAEDHFFLRNAGEEPVHRPLFLELGVAAAAAAGGGDDEDGDSDDRQEDRPGSQLQEPRATIALVGFGFAAPALLLSPLALALVAHRLPPSVTPACAPAYPTSRVAFSRKRIVISTALATHHWQIAS